CLAALAGGPSTLVGVPASSSPLAALRALGLEATEDENQIALRGPAQLRPPSEPVACEDATTLALLAGLLAGRPEAATLRGPAPSDALVRGLQRLGATVHAETDGLRLAGGALRGTTVNAPTADDKAALLLAGLRAEGTTTVVTSAATPDHTERLLGLDALTLGDDRHVTVRGGSPIGPGLWVVPRDFDAAAPLLVAAATVTPSVLALTQVGLNPTRAALLEVLQAMGARHTVRNERERRHEPMADLVAGNESGGLHSVAVSGLLTRRLTPHLPLVLTAAAHAEGTTAIHDVPASARPAVTATLNGLRAMGADAEATAEGCTVRGGSPLHGAEVDAQSYPVVAQALAVAALTASGETTLHGAEAAGDDFWDALDELRGESEEAA
ncbi:MAG: 3-phosphoshikimate 1-carboxyvinyltransferase, partial [Rhodothermales bacterium]|nr:3-phosphoshikimate 1-carboxyvinyltransferase [Rhodothermales bacterium]